MLHQRNSRNLKKVSYPVTGAVYVIQLTPDDNEGFKIGSTQDMNKRLQVYKTSMKDDPNVVYIFYSHDANQLEKCIKLALRDYSYRKDKEYYKVTRDIIIDVIADCQYLITKYECKQCNIDAKIEKLSRHNKNYNYHDNETMIITTIVEYDDVDDKQDDNQIGGSCSTDEKHNFITIYDLSVMYRLNKTLYHDLCYLNKLMNDWKTAQEYKYLRTT
jgi:hypothetical protein